MVGIDVAFDNPIFACLEIDYEVNKMLECIKPYFELIFEENFCILVC